MEKLKAYVYVIVSGLGLLAAVVFAALQWGNQSTFSAYGPTVSVRTIWLVLASAAGGLAFYWLCRLLARGGRILWRLRGEQARIAAEVQRQEKRAGGGSGPQKA